MGHRHIRENLLCTMEAITIFEDMELKTSCQRILRENIPIDIRNQLVQSLQKQYFLFIGDSDSETKCATYLNYLKKYENIGSKLENVLIANEDEARDFCENIKKKGDFSFTYVLVSDIKLFEICKDYLNLDRVNILDFYLNTENIDKDFPLYSEIFNHIYIYPLFDSYVVRKILNFDEKLIYVASGGYEDGRYLEYNINKLDVKSQIIKEIYRAMSDTSYEYKNFSSEKNIVFKCNKDLRFKDNYTEYSYHNSNDKLNVAEDNVISIKKYLKFGIDEFKSFIKKVDDDISEYYFGKDKSNLIKLQERYDFIRGSYLTAKAEIITDKINNYKHFEKLTKLYNLKNLSNDIFEEKDFDIIVFDEDLKKKYQIKKGDILISIRGTSFKTAYVLDEPEEGAIISNNLCIIRPKEQVEQNIVLGDFLWINSDSIREYINYITSSSKVSNINIGTIGDILIRNEYSADKIKKIDKYLKLLEEIKDLKGKKVKLESEISEKD